MSVSQRCYKESSIGSDHGFALPLVIGALAVNTVVAMAAYVLSTQVNKESTVVQSESMAFQAANAGIDRAIAILSHNGYKPSDWTSPLQVTQTELGSGSATVRVAPYAGGYQFQITSDGSGTDGTKERIVVEFFYLNLYSFNISANGNPTSGAALRGNSSIYGPFYGRGTMDLSRANVSVEKGPLLVKNGGITLGGSSCIGSDALRMLVYCDGAINGTNSRNWYVSKLMRSTPLITLPTVDAKYLRTMFDKSKAESVDNRMGLTPATNVEKTEGYSGIEQYTNWTIGSFSGTCATVHSSPAFTSAYYKTVASGVAPSSVGEGPTSVVIDASTQSFGKFTYDPANPTNTGPGYHTYDDFAYDASTGTLYVNGTVFIDGDLTIARDVVYKGNGVIVCNGDISVMGFRPQQALVADANGTPNQNFREDEIVGLVSPTHITLTGNYGNDLKQYNDPPDVAAALFCAQTVSLPNNINFAGSVICALIEAPLTGTNPHIRTAPNLPDVISESMPGRGLYLSTVAAWARQNTW